MHSMIQKASFHFKLSILLIIMGKFVLSEGTMKFHSSLRSKRNEIIPTRNLSNLICDGKNLEEVIDLSQDMSSEDGFECFKVYFESLGVSMNATMSMNESNSNVTNTTNDLMNTGNSSLFIDAFEGKYLGDMKWFNGAKSLKRIVNRLWIGVRCDGNATCEILSRVRNSPQDIGYITYEDICPELDAYPCLKIDFTNGPIPRFYYTRPVSNTTYLSFVHTQDGSNSYSDVNVLQLQQKQ